MRRPLDSGRVAAEPRCDLPFMLHRRASCTLDGCRSLVTDHGEVEMHAENGRLTCTFTPMPTHRELQLCTINWTVPLNAKQC